MTLVSHTALRYDYNNIIITVNTVYLFSYITIRLLLLNCCMTLMGLVLKYNNNKYIFINTVYYLLYTLKIMEIWNFLL